MLLKLDYLERTLRELEARKQLGENVQAEIDWVTQELDRYQVNNHRASASAQPSSNLSFKTGGNASFNAVGNNNTVNYNPQQINKHTHINPLVQLSQPGSSLDVAVQIVWNTCLWIYNKKPSAVSVSLVTILPILFLFGAGKNNPVVALGTIGLFTITPLGLYVLSGTHLFALDENDYKDNITLTLASKVMRILGILGVIVFVASFLLAVIILRAIMEAISQLLHIRL
ncbi:MAG: hypothetical protein ACYDBJ_13280 [Aggregatilineales bacterium]